MHEYFETVTATLIIARILSTVTITGMPIVTNTGILGNCHSNTNNHKKT